MFVNLFLNQNGEHQETLFIRGRITAQCVLVQIGNSVYHKSTQGMFLALVSASSTIRGLLYLAISSCCPLSILSNCSIKSSSLTFPLQRTSSAALRTPPQACLSHGLLAQSSLW